MGREFESFEDTTIRELARSGVEAIWAREALLYRLRHKPDPHLAEQQRQYASGLDQRQFPTPGSRHSVIQSILERERLLSRARNKG